MLMSIQTSLLKKSIRPSSGKSSECIQVTNVSKSRTHSGT